MKSDFENRKLCLPKCVIGWLGKIPIGLKLLEFVTEILGIGS
jgi:hypothetical protein